MSITEREIAILENRAHYSDRLRDAMRNGVIDEILEDINKQAYEAFKNVDPNDSKLLIETQQMGQIVDTLRKHIRSKLEEGRLAQEQIKNFQQEKEDEENEQEY